MKMNLRWWWIWGEDDIWGDDDIWAMWMTRSTSNEDISSSCIGSGGSCTPTKSYFVFLFQKDWAKTWPFITYRFENLCWKTKPPKNIYGLCVLSTLTPRLCNSSTAPILRYEKGLTQESGLTHCHLSLIMSLSWRASQCCIRQHPFIPCIHCIW